MKGVIFAVVLLIFLTGCVEKEIVEVKETPSEIMPTPGTELPEPLEPSETEEAEEEVLEEEEPKEEAEIHEEPETHVDKKIAYVWINRGGFDPSELNITKGTKVIWINNNSVGHIFKQIGKGFRSPIIKVGDIFEHTFNESEVFRYADINFGTKGKIVIE